MSGAIYSGPLSLWAHGNESGVLGNAAVLIPASFNGNLEIILSGYADALRPYCPLTQTRENYAHRW